MLETKIFCVRKKRCQTKSKKFNEDFIVLNVKEFSVSPTWSLDSTITWQQWEPWMSRLWSLISTDHQNEQDSREKQLIAGRKHVRWSWAMLSRKNQRNCQRLWRWGQKNAGQGAKGLPFSCARHGSRKSHLIFSPYNMPYKRTVQLCSFYRWGRLSDLPKAMQWVGGWVRIRTLTIWLCSPCL